MYVLLWGLKLCPTDHETETMGLQPHCCCHPVDLLVLVLVLVLTSICNIFGYTLKIMKKWRYSRTAAVPFRHVRVLLLPASVYFSVLIVHMNEHVYTIYISKLLTIWRKRKKKMAYIFNIYYAFFKGKRIKPDTVCGTPPKNVFFLFSECHLTWE